MSKFKPFFVEHIQAEGSWYDIGLTQGRAARMMVRHTIHTYLKFKKFHAGSPVLDKLPEMMQKVKKFLTERFPQEWEELKGIADGAEVDLSWLVAVNFSDALLSLCTKTISFPDLNSFPEPENQKCGGLIFPSSDFGPLLGGTLDNLPDQYLLTAYPKDGIALCCIRYPGLIATWGGMNEAGLVMSGASVSIFQESNFWEDKNILGFSALRAISPLLRSCRTVEQALDRFSQNDLIVPRNLGMLDKNGSAVLVQGCIKKSPELRVQRPESGSGLCWGNIWPWDIDLNNCEDIPEEKKPKSAFARYNSLRNAVENNKGKYSLDLMKQVLTSHDASSDLLHAYNVCNDSTNFAMIAAPARGKLLFASQPPCIQGFEDYSFGK